MNVNRIVRKIKQFFKIFRKVNGKEILQQYIHAHVFFFALIETVILGFSSKSLEIVRLAVNNKILKKLEKRYKNEIIEIKLKYSNEKYKKIKTDKIWICWFQGMENAPEIVQICYNSIKKHIQNHEIILITKKNYRQYISFPNYIEEKYSKGIISNTHLSDLLRLEILNQYGGTWIDSTVLCTSENIPNFMFDSDLFVFQTLKPGLDGQSIPISNWFITACSHEPILDMTLKLLYNYWNTENKLVNYYIFHFFFQIAIKAYPDEWNNVIPCTNETPHILQLNLFKKYNEYFLNSILSQGAFHKLTYKFNKNRTYKFKTNYDQIIKTYGGDICAKVKHNCSCL